MLKIPIQHKSIDLQMTINICSQLVKQSTNYIDYVDYYNIWNYCKSLRTKKENIQQNFATKFHKREVTISVNLNELKSLQKLFDLNIIWFQESKNIYETLLFKGILEQYEKHKNNHILQPF
jgi:hypothetical protein